MRKTPRKAHLLYVDSFNLVRQIKRPKVRRRSVTMFPAGTSQGWRVNQRKTRELTALQVCQGNVDFCWPACTRHRQVPDPLHGRATLETADKYVQVDEHREHHGYPNDYCERSGQLNPEHGKPDAHFHGAHGDSVGQDAEIRELQGLRDLRRWD